MAEGIENTRLKVFGDSDYGKERYYSAIVLNEFYPLFIDYINFFKGEMVNFTYNGPLTILTDTDAVKDFLEPEEEVATQEKNCRVKFDIKQITGVTTDENNNIINQEYNIPYAKIFGGAAYKYINQFLKNSTLELPEHIDLDKIIPDTLDIDVELGYFTCHELNQDAPVAGAGGEVAGKKLHSCIVLYSRSSQFQTKLSEFLVNTSTQFLRNNTTKIDEIKAKLKAKNIDISMTNEYETQMRRLNEEKDYEPKLMLLDNSIPIHISHELQKVNNTVINNRISFDINITVTEGEGKKPIVFNEHFLEMIIKKQNFVERNPNKVVIDGFYFDSLPELLRKQVVALAVRYYEEEGSFRREKCKLDYGRILYLFKLINHFYTKNTRFGVTRYKLNNIILGAFTPNFLQKITVIREELKGKTEFGGSIEIGKILDEIQKNFNYCTFDEQKGGKKRKGRKNRRTKTGKVKRKNVKNTKNAKKRRKTLKKKKQ